MKRFLQKEDDAKIELLYDIGIFGWHLERVSLSPQFSPDLGSPDFSPLSHRPIGIKFGIRVLLINAHGQFLSVSQNSKKNSSKNLYF